MKSKTSLLNSTLYWKNIKRFWPLWVGYLLILILRCPWLLYHRATEPYGYENQEMIFYLLNGDKSPEFFAVMCMAIACAMALWSYLYFPKSSTWVHSLPIKRSTIFVTNVLSGLSMMIVPALAAYGLGVAVAAAFHLPHTILLVQWMFAIIGISILFFGMATLLAMITGNIIVLPALYFIFQCVGEYLFVMARGFKNTLVYGCSDNWNDPYWLSPIFAVYRGVGMDVKYEENGAIMDYSFLGAKTVVIGVIAGILMMSAAYLLYRKHHTERCGDIITVNWMRPIMKYGFIVCFASLVTVFLYSIGVFNGLERSSGSILLVISILVWITGLFGYFISEMLLQKSFRVFSGRHLVKCILFNAIMIVPLIVLNLDVFGYAKWVPETSEVESIIINSGYGTISDSDTIEEVIALHQEIVDNRKLYQKRQITMSGVESPEEDWRTDWVHLEYQLKNGKVRARNYEILTTKKEQLQKGVYQDLYDLMNQPKVVYAQYFPDGFDVSRADDISVDHYEVADEITTDSTSFSISNEQRKQQLFEAMKKDIESGDLKVEGEYWEKDNKRFRLDMTYHKPDDSEPVYMRIEIDEKSAETMKFLQKMEKLYNQ